ncbi:MAG TPA: hypothetical protein GXX73_09320 [Clostridium sp.]|nr:hypothetical protein [Clostridium sp.]
MKIEKIQTGDITSLIKDFDNHIIYYFDSLKSGKGQVEIDTDNINEAFFFEEGKCLHIYREEGIKGILYIEESDSEFIIEKQILEEKILKEPLRALIVKKYIEYDEDGQAYISRALPSMLI